MQLRSVIIALLTFQGLPCAGQGISIGTGISVSASQFGCNGNGTFDNTACLAALQSFLVSSGGGTVYFPPGKYQYRHNYWLQGTGNVHILADGVTFQDISNPSDFFDLAPNCDYLGVNANPNNSYQTWQTGHLIQTVIAGSTTITLNTTSEYTSFGSGHYVLIAGYDQQGVPSYPPNLRYNEIHKILSVSSSGVITLDAPLNYNYDSRWYNTLVTNGGSPPSSFNQGAPIAIDLDHATGPGPCTVTPYLTIEGATIANNPNGGDDGYPTLGLGSVLTAGVLNFTCIRCTLGYIDISSSENVKLVDSYAHLYELDKLVDTAICDNCVLDQTNDATGVRNVVIKNSRLQGGPMFTISPKSVEIDNSQIFENPNYQYGGFLNVATGDTNTYNLKLTGNIFYQSSASSPAYYNTIVSGMYVASLTVLTAPTSASITVPVEWTNTLNGLDYGAHMFTAGFAKTGVVTAIYYNGTNTTIEGVFSSPPAMGDVFYFEELWSATVLGNSMPYQENNIVADFVSGVGPYTPAAQYMNSVSSDFNRVSAVDTGCVSVVFPVAYKGYVGKIWVDTADPNNTVIKECEMVSGTLAWITK